VWTWTQELQVADSTVTGSSEASWGALAALDIERVLFDTESEVTNGEITHIRFDIDFSDPDSVKWRDALYASVAPPAGSTGSAGLASSDHSLPTWPWQMFAGGAVLALVLSARLLTARQYGGVPLGR